jgi:TetR/AcrR family transcriptional repressor of nem operon
VPNATSTSDEILACARSLIITGGYNGFSYADIAAEVGIRKPSIHHYFPTKVDLVRTLVSQYRKEAETGIAAIERHASDPVEMLHAYTDFWVTCITDGTAPFCVCAMLASELPLLPPSVAHEVTAHFRALSAWLTSVIDRGAQRGSLQVATEPRREAEAFMATVHGAMLSARAYGDPEVFGTIVNQQLERLSVSA